jgi:hypothetical protein
MRVVLSALLLLVATQAWAGWVKLTEANETAYYVDPATVGDKGNLRRVSVIQDYARPDAGGVRSRQVLYEIDCSGGRLRSLSVSEHSDAMGQGKRLNSWERESDWLYVAPRTGSNIPSRTPYRPIVSFVCSR